MAMCRLYYVLAGNVCPCPLDRSWSRKAMNESPSQQEKLLAWPNGPLGSYHASKSFITKDSIPFGQKFV